MGTPACPVFLYVRIAFPAAPTFLEINGFPLQVDPADGLEFIHGSLDRHEFRFPKIADWMRLQTQPIR
jgi:prophage maintenance system killer protein